MAVLIDTSVLVAAERGLLALDDRVHDDETYALSVVTAAELLHGVHRASGPTLQTRSAFVEALLAGLPTVPIDVAVARAYAIASAELARTGATVDANDLWIGATAIAHGFSVLALDGDFDRIPGVTRAARP